MRMDDLSCRNCIFSLKVTTPVYGLRCFKSPPPRNKEQVSPSDVCSRGEWMVRRKVEDFSYENPLPMGYKTLLGYILNDSYDEDFFIVVPVW